MLKKAFGVKHIFRPSKNVQTVWDAPMGADVVISFFKILILYGIITPSLLSINIVFANGI